MTTIIDIQEMFGGKEKKETRMGCRKLRARNEKVVIEGVLDDGHKITFYESGYGLIPMEDGRDLVLHITDVVENPFMFNEDAFYHQKAGDFNIEDYYVLDWKTYIYFQMIDRLQHRIDAIEEHLRACTYDDGIDCDVSESAEEEFFRELFNIEEEEKRKRVLDLMKETLKDYEYDSLYGYYGKGETQEKLAKKENIKQQAVYNRLRRGKERLNPVMQKLKDIYYDNEE